jgi:hypothetical protein
VQWWWCGGGVRVCVGGGGRRCVCHVMRDVVSSKVWVVKAWQELPMLIAYLYFEAYSSTID